MEKKIYLCAARAPGHAPKVGFISEVPVEAGDVVSVAMETGPVVLAHVGCVTETTENSEIHQWLKSFYGIRMRKLLNVYKAAP